MNKETWFIIANTTAARGRASNTIDNVIHTLNHKKIPFEIELTKYPKHAVKISKKAVEAGFKLLVAIGGDGTINEVANGIMLSGKQTKLGMIPEGGGNDFAKIFSIPRNVQAAVNVIQHGNSHKIDVGRFNTTYFVNVLGMGLDAQVAKIAAQNCKLNGFARYLWALMKALKRLKYQTLQIVCKEFKITGQSLLLSIGNGQYCGGGFRLTPNAKVNDGKFNVCLIDPLSRRQIFKLLPKAIKGKHIGLPMVHCFQTNKLEISSEDPITFYYDGELPEQKIKQLTIEILPRALELVY